MLNETIDFIKENLLVEELLVYLGIEYTPKGEELNFLCPFHEEKTPSMFLNKTKLFYKCFGCGASGDIIDFVMKFMNYDFKKTISFLKDFLDSNFINPDQNKIYRYKKINKLKLDTIFPIGDSLYPDYLKERNISLETAEHFKVGLCISGHFKDRIIIPVINKNKIVAYLGRDITGRSPRKYLNLGSINNYIFNYKEEDNNIYVVEGVFDVFSLYQSNFTNCVSTFGNLLTPIQKSLLFKKDKIFLIPDNDNGGKVLIKELEEHPNLYIGYLPSKYKDANECPQETLKKLDFKKLNKKISISEISIQRRLI